MNRQAYLCALLTFAAIPALKVRAALPAYYVSDQDSMYTQTTSTDNVQDIDQPFNASGPLQQTSVGYTNKTGADGSDYYIDGIIRPQHADGFVSDTATMGALHAVASTDASTDGYPYSAVTASSSVHSTTTWSDTVNLITTNPGGSDFTAMLNVHDGITNSVTYDNPIATASGSVTAKVDIVGVTLGAYLHPELYIVDVESEQNESTYSAPPASYNEAFTFHVYGYEQVVITATLDVLSNASGAETSNLTDASDTAQFFLNSSDPLAYYTTASGATYVPEPATLTLLALAAAAIPLRRRRR